MKIQDNICADEEIELEDFQAFTKKWLTITNRGGLFCINDGTGIKNMTISTTSDIITVTKCEIIAEIQGDDDVQFQWCIISA